MEKYLPGAIHQIEEVPPGSCILFAIHQKAQVGFIVEVTPGKRGILDLDAEPQEGNKRPAIYMQESFSNERIFVYDNPKIVPSIAPECIGFEYHGGGGPSKALYLCEAELIVLAAFRHNRVRVNIETGLLSQIDVAYGLHCLRWQVQVPDVIGDYQKLVEFSA